MAQVMQLPDGLLERTTGWLVSRKAGNGQFQRNPQSLGAGVSTIRLVVVVVLLPLVLVVMVVVLAEEGDSNVM